MAPSAKRKRASSGETFKESRQKIRTLEASLSDKSNLNNLVELTKFTKSDNAQVVHASIHALHRVYTQFLMANDLKKPKVVDESSAKTKVQLWLRENYLDYVNFVRSLLSSDEPGLQLPALNILITLIKSESDHAMNNSGAYHFANDVYGPTVRAIINNTNFSEPLRRELIEKYLNVYDDLRHYFFKDAAELIEKAIKEKDEEIMKRSKKAKKTDNTKEDQASKVLSLVATNVYAIVEGIRTMPTDASEIDEFWTVNPTKYEAKKESKKMDDLLGDEGLLSDDDVAEEEEENKSKKKASKTHPLLQLLVHKRGFSSCWLALLKLPMSEEMYKKILLILHKRILPHMSQPKLLMDFLTDSYNIGGSVSLLALNGLFTLIVEHNLDYPDFYHKLYTILDRNVLHVKYRSRFFRLLELFLSSAYLPAALIASFIKRMARLSLTAPPAASAAIIPFIYNLLKRHPTCMTLIHSNKASAEAEDPFSMAELDPYKTNAMESSLWEVKTLAEHYYANVSTLAKIFSEQFLKPKYNLEDFLDHTYATFFTTEIDRKRKKEPAMAIDKPTASTWEI